MQNGRGPLKKVLTRRLRFFACHQSSLLDILSWHDVCPQMEMCWLHGTAQWRAFVPCLTVGGCLQPALRLSLCDLFLSWRVSTGNSQHFVQRAYDQHYFVGFFHLLHPVLLSSSSCEQIAGLLQTPSRSSSLYLSNISQVSVGRHTSKHNLNQYLKNSESWAAASLLETWLEEELKAGNENWLWSVSRPWQLCLFSKALSHKQVVESL